MTLHPLTRRLALLATLASIFLCADEPARAAYQPGAIVAPQPVANIAAITGAHWGPAYLTLHVAGAASNADGGDGNFAYQSTPCTAYGPYCIQDLDGNYYLRSNIDGTMAQLGVTVGSAYDWNVHGVSSTDISPLLASAQTALTALGIYDIHTAGVSVYFATSFALATKTTLNCDIIPGTTDNAEGYVSVPGSLVKAHGVNLNRAGNGAVYTGCYIRPYWYSVAPTNAQTGFAVLAQMVSDGDTGLICDQASCADSNLTIIGFDTGYQAVNAPDLVANNIKIDANVCVFVNSTGGASRFNNINCFTYITRSVPNAAAVQQFTITRVDNDAGPCKLTVTPQGSASLSDLQYINYFYVTGLVSTSASCEGIWKISNLNIGAGTFDLIGSSALGPTAFAHWASGTNVIYTSNDANIANGNVINGKDAQGIPSGTTVLQAWDLPIHPSGYLADTGAVNAYVVVGSSTTQPCNLADKLNVYWTPANTNTGASTLNVTLNSQSGCSGGTTGALAIVRQDGTAVQANDLIAGVNYFVIYNLGLNSWVLQQPKVILSTRTTLAQSAPLSTRFLNTVCTSCGTAPTGVFLVSARVDAGASAGGVAAGGLLNATGYMVGGPAPQNLQDTDRVAGFNCTNCDAFDHSIEAHITNSNETNFTDFRTDSHGFTQNPRQVIVLLDGQDNNMHLTGVKATKGGHSIVVNNAYPNSDGRGCFTWTGASVSATVGDQTVLDVEQGCLWMLSGVSNITGAVTIGNNATATRFDIFMPKTTFYYEGALAQSITCMLGSIIAAGNVCPRLNPLSSIITTSQQIDLTAHFWQCDATSGNVTLTLVPAALDPNWQATFEKVDSSANACIVSTFSGDSFLDGTSSYYLYNQNQSTTTTSQGATNKWIQ